MLTTLGGCLLLMGCINSDYDFNKVDSTLGFGSGQLTLPSNNSVIVTLDDILDLGSSDLISTDANGDYLFSKDPESVSPITVNIAPITNTGFNRDIPIDAITIDGSLTAYAGQPVKLSDLGLPTLKVSQDISSFEYSFDVPEEVSELNYVTLDGNGANLAITLTLPSVKSLKKCLIKLPEQLIMENTGVGTLSDDNTLTLPAGTVVNNNKVELTFKVQEIKAKMNAQHQFTLNDNISMDAEIDEIVVPSTPTIQLSGHATLSTLVVTAANGIFKPTINTRRAGSTTINSLPNFLTDARVVADIDNPQIWLDITSNMPLGGLVEARLGSSTLNGFVELTKANGNALTVAPNGTTRLVICRKAPSALSGYTPVIAEDLSNIIKKLVEGMEITIDITRFDAVQDAPVTILLGHDYTFTPDYRFNALLALGDNAVIVYNDNEGDWHKDIKDIQLSKNAKAILTANVKNGTPADLEIDITPLGQNGQTLGDLVVKPIKNTVKAGVADGQIEYEITDVNGTGLKQLDGINYHLNVTAPSDASQKGKTLNKNQQIILKDITLQLNGKIVVDAN